jgi:hypothetical protein
MQIILFLSLQYKKNCKQCLHNNNIIIIPCSYGNSRFVKNYHHDCTFYFRTFL